MGKRARDRSRHRLLLSTENLRRPVEELDPLFEVFIELFERLPEQANAIGYQLRFIGSIDLLPPELSSAAKQAEEKSAAHDRWLTISLGYGGRQEIADDASPATTATFSAAGTYVLRLLADDSELNSSDTVTVSVAEPAVPIETTVVLESSLHKRYPTRSFVVNASGGDMTATLEAVVSSRGKKPKIRPELALSIYDENDELIGEALSPAEWSALDLPAGQYTFEVGGDARASFLLEITDW